ncbi:hypothetical protein K439DRAFT_194332 [Ramaria rubella]|nr:hypothetical protein K439DRAFT_194332 [Ramaria rubella]
MVNYLEEWHAFAWGVQQVNRILTHVNRHGGQYEITPGWEVSTVKDLAFSLWKTDLYDPLERNLEESFRALDLEDSTAFEFRLSTVSLPVMSPQPVDAPSSLYTNSPAILPLREARVRTHSALWAFGQMVTPESHRKRQQVQPEC